jgi:hypothetical protein
MRFEILPSDIHLTKSDRSKRVGPQPPMPPQPFCQMANEFIDKQGIELVVQLAKGIEQKSGKAAVGNHRIGDEWQAEAGGSEAPR